MQGNLGSMKDGARKQKPVTGRASECTCADKLRGRITRRHLGFSVVDNFLCQSHLCLLFLAGGRAGTVHLDSLSAGILLPLSCLPFLLSPGHVIEGIAQFRKQQVGLFTPILHSCHQD